MLCNKNWITLCNKNWTILCINHFYKIYNFPLEKSLQIIANGNYEEVNKYLNREKNN